MELIEQLKNDYPQLFWWAIGMSGTALAACIAGLCYLLRIPKHLLRDEGTDEDHRFI